MNNQTFMLFSGFIIAGLGLAYIVSERFARAYFYHRNAFGRRNIHTYFLSERTGVLIFRFILGPILLIVGSALVFKAW